MSCILQQSKIYCSGKRARRPRRPRRRRRGGTGGGTGERECYTRLFCRFCCMQLVALLTSGCCVSDKHVPQINLLESVIIVRSTAVDVSIQGTIRRSLLPEVPFLRVSFIRNYHSLLLRSFVKPESRFVIDRNPSNGFSYKDTSTVCVSSSNGQYVSNVTIDIIGYGGGS